GAVARSLLRLRREKRVAAAVLHHLANVLLAPTIGAAIDRRRIDVIHAKIERFFDDRDGDGFIVGLLERSLTAQTEDADLVSGLSEIASWHGIRDRSTGRRT